MGTVLTPQEQAAGLFAGVGAVLLVASLIGYVLKLSIARGQPHGGIDNLNARIKAWWVIVFVIGVAFLLDRPGITLLFLFVSFAALREFALQNHAPRIGPAMIGASFVVALPLQYALVYAGWQVAFSIVIPVYVLAVLPVIAAASGDTRRFVERATTMQWGVMICVFCISHVPALLTLEIPGYEGRDLLLIAFFILVVQSSDVLQYVWGKLLGRHPVAPAVSPSKTWEGLVGGVASATALGAALFWITPFDSWQAAGMAFIINVLGFCGGLVMSAIKRDRGIKDWGRMIEGHGGMLDRLDSVVFAAPVFFHLTRIGWT